MKVIFIVLLIYVISVNSCKSNEENKNTKIKLFETSRKYDMEYEMNNWVELNRNIIILNMGVNRSDDDYRTYYIGYIVYRE